eukprot:jgi/Mesvir1/5106/Mv15266-RA.1
MSIAAVMPDGGAAHITDAFNDKSSEPAPPRPNLNESLLQAFSNDASVKNLELEVKAAAFNSRLGAIIDDDDGQSSMTSDQESFYNDDSFSLSRKSSLGREGEPAPAGGRLGKAPSFGRVASGRRVALPPPISESASPDARTSGHGKSSSADADAITHPTNGDSASSGHRYSYSAPPNLVKTKSQRSTDEARERRKLVMAKQRSKGSKKKKAATKVAVTTAPEPQKARRRFEPEADVPPAKNDLSHKYENLDEDARPEDIRCCVAARWWGANFRQNHPNLFSNTGKIYPIIWILMSSMVLTVVFLGDAGWDPLKENEDAIMTALMGLWIFFNVSEALCRMIFGSRNYDVYKIVFLFYLFLCVLVGIFVLTVTVVDYNEKGAKVAGRIVLLVFIFLRTGEMLFFQSRLKPILVGLNRVKGLLGLLIMPVFFMMYIFAIIGWKIYPDVCEEIETPCTWNHTTEEAECGVGEVCHFGSVPQALWTLWLLMTLNFYEVAQATMAVHRWSWAYFLVFTVAFGFLIINVFMAIIIDAIRVQHDTEIAAEKQRAEDLEKMAFDTLVLMHKVNKKVGDTRACEGVGCMDDVVAWQGEEMCLDMRGQSWKVSSRTRR